MTEHLTLREEYKHRKLTKQAHELQEARELLESVVLIMEKLDTQSISRIVDAMHGVEKVMEPFLDKLPTMRMGLDAAEKELVALISGRAGNDPRKTQVMLGKALAFYSGISEFLRDDLGVLLRSRAFKEAQANPEAPVGPRMEPIFGQALAIQHSGGFLKKLFASSNIPYINNQSFAKELTGLSFKELTTLAQVGKVPQVNTQAEVEKAASSAAGQTPGTAAPAPQENPPAPEQNSPMGNRGKRVKAAVAKALEPWTNDPAALDAATQAALKSLG